MTNEFGAVVTRPVEQLLAVDGDEGHAVRFLQINRERLRFGDDIFAEFGQHGGRLWAGKNVCGHTRFYLE